MFTMTFADAPNDPDQEYWYRVDHYHGASFDSDGDWQRSYDTCKIQKFKVISHTPKGVWLDVYGEKKFVLGTSRKQYAVPTEELAYLDFLYRSNRYVNMMQARIKARQESMMDAVGSLRRLDVEIPRRYQHIIDKLNEAEPIPKINIKSLMRGSR